MIFNNFDNSIIDLLLPHSNSISSKYTFRRLKRGTGYHLAAPIHSLTKILCSVII